MPRKVQMGSLRDIKRQHGEVAEWSKALPWKGSVWETGPRVRISPSPLGIGKGTRKRSLSAIRLRREERSTISPMDLNKIKSEVAWFTTEVRNNEQDVTRAERALEDAKRKLEGNKRKLEGFERDAERAEREQKQTA